MRKVRLIVLGAVLFGVQPAFAQAFGPALGDAELGTVAGKADIARNIIEAQNNAVVSNNTINGVSTTGGVSIDGSAFQNLTGLAVVSANTGNNVVINSSLNVNVTLRP